MAIWFVNGACASIRGGERAQSSHSDSGITDLAEAGTASQPHAGSAALKFFLVFPGG